MILSLLNITVVDAHTHSVTVIKIVLILKNIPLYIKKVYIAQTGYVLRYWASFWFGSVKCFNAFSKKKFW